MTNILIEGGSHIPSYDILVNDFYRYAELIPIAVRAKLTRNITPKDISWCDILVTVRANNPLSAWVAQIAKKKGRKVILFLDDDLLNYTSREHSIIDTFMKKSLNKVLKISSDMITFSKYLGEKYKKTYGINYTLVDTVFESKDIRETLPSTEKVKLVYAAAKNHVVYFNKLILPILDRLYERYGDYVSLTLIGPEINTENLKLHIEQVHSMPMEAYQNYMRTHRFDIGLAPLFDTEFSYSKHYNKHLEYSKNNIFGIYSYQLPYTSVIVNGENGLLASETPESWYKNLCVAIDNDNLRKEGVLLSQQQLLMNNNAKAIIRRVVIGIPYLTTFKAPSYKSKLYYFLYIRFCLYELFRRILLRFNTKK